jgi:ribosomal protein S13
MKPMEHLASDGFRTYPRLTSLASKERFMFFFLYEDIKCMVMISLNRTKMTTIEFIGFKTTIRWINEAKQKKEMKLRELEKEEMQMIMEVQTQRALIKAAIEEERDENCQESLEA